MTRLFAYGTLMCDDIMLTVAGSLPPSIHGTLYGYCRRRVRNESFPAIIKDEKSTVDGVVYLSVPPTAWEMLDRFEGEMYERVPVEVETRPEGTVLALAYVCRPSFFKNLSQSVWDYHEFTESGKSVFLKSYGGFMNLNAGNPVL